MNRIKFHVKKGDQVEVISGNFKGSSGKILEVLPQKQRVLIEGVRIIKKHLRKSQDNPTGKIAEREGPIHISNVKLVERETKPEKKSSTHATARHGVAQRARIVSQRAGSMMRSDHSMSLVLSQSHCAKRTLQQTKKKNSAGTAMSAGHAVSARRA